MWDNRDLTVYFSTGNPVEGTGRLSLSRSRVIKNLKLLIVC